MYILALLPLLFAAAAATPQEKHETKCTEIDAQDFYSNVKLDPSIKIIDVRMKAEYKTGKIKNAVNIPLSKRLPRKARSLDKEAVYYLYCAGGVRSCRAEAQYEAAGFKHVYSLKGGIKGWKNSGLPVD